MIDTEAKELLTNKIDCGIIEEATPKKKDIKIWQVLDDFYIESNSFDLQGRPKRVVNRIAERTIKNKYGKQVSEGIDYFESECYIPQHSNYQSRIGGSKNLYSPLNIEAKEGDISTWLKLIKHIGQDQYDLLMDYLIVMFSYPIEKLPILCLVSEENSTGKSTFSNKLAYLLGRNAGFYSQSDLESQFNVWVMNKLAVFEEISDTKKVAGKLKDISTSQQTTVNRKGMQQFQFEPCVSIIINSNNVETCLQLNENDSRYFVLKVPPISKEDYDKDFESKLDKEAPAMLWHLLNTKPMIKRQSRMWFPLEMLRTKQLDVIVEANKTELYHSIKIIIDELEGEAETIHLRIKDLQTLLKDKYSGSQISTCLRTEFKMRPTQKTISWEPYYGIQGEKQRLTGKPYIFKRETCKAE